MFTSSKQLLFDCWYLTFSMPFDIWCSFPFSGKVLNNFKFLLGSIYKEPSTRMRFGDFDFWIMQKYQNSRILNWLYELAIHSYPCSC